jgi:nicotine blue oxidoreductase
MTTAGLLLAAGAGRRMGGPKALLCVGGELLVDRAARVLAAGDCRPVLAVLGAGADEVRRNATLRGVLVTVNDAWTEGLGSSLRAGLAALAGAAPDVAACVVTLVDTPGVTEQAVRRIAGRAERGRAVVATYAGRRAHPVALGRDLWSPIGREARGDVGARGFLGTHSDLVVEVPCDDVGSPDDLDTPEALAAYERGSRAR